MLYYQVKSLIRNVGRLMIISQIPVSSLPHDAYAASNGFRSGFYDCLTHSGDALFGLIDAETCGASPITDLAWLGYLEAQHKRGHGGLYDALDAGVESPTLTNCVQLRCPKS